MNRSSRRVEDLATKMESKYPSLDEVDVIPMPSLGEAFRYAERQQLHQPNGEQDKSLRRQDAPRSSNASRQSTASSGSREKQRERQSSADTRSTISGQSLKMPTLQRLKSSDLLDTKPPAVMRPAATPGVVEVSHSPYFMHHQESNHGWMSSQASVASQRSMQASTGATSRSRYQSPARPPAFPRMELEVSPGVFLPLHGSEETYAALRSDRLCATYCLACETPLFCVEYAAQVLCPNCRVVSPVFTHETSRNDYSNAPQAGIGLGMTVDEYDRTWAEAEERMAAQYSRGYYDAY